VPQPPERIVLVAPVASRRSRAAAVLRALLPALTRGGTRVVLVVEDAASAAAVPAAAGAAEVTAMTVAEWRRAPLLAALPHLFELADHPDHAFVRRAALERPGGGLVLHDLSLHRLVAGMTLGTGAARGYEAAMAEAYGLPGRRLARLRQEGFHSPAQAARLPLHHALLDGARHVVVHHRGAVAWLRGGAGEPPPASVAPCCAPPPPATAPDRGAARARLGLRTGEEPVLLAPEGAGAAALRVLAALRAQGGPGASAVLLLRGEDARDEALAAAAGEMGVADRVHARLSAEEDEATALRAADLFLDLRPPEAATAGPLAAAFAAGLPALAWDLGPAGECPEEAVARLPFTADPAAPARAAAGLLADAPRRALLGRWAQTLMQTDWTPERAAMVYRAVLASLS
jgi:hypothetical protein